MEEIKIDSGVEIPARGRKIKGWGKRLSEMQIGDSFLLPANENKTVVYITGKRMGITLLGRQTEEGYRMWRTK